jgi:hypothetical protein
MKPIVLDVCAQCHRDGERESIGRGWNFDYLRGSTFSSVQSPKPTQLENGRADSNLVRRSAEKTAAFYRHSPRNLHAQVIVIDV